MQNYNYGMSLRKEASSPLPRPQASCREHAIPLYFEASNLSGVVFFVLKRLAWKVVCIRAKLKSLPAVAVVAVGRFTEMPSGGG